MKRTSTEIFRKAGIKEPRKEIGVIELYQPYSFAGIIWIEDMGIVEPGKGAEFIWSGATDMGGELPVNPSGGVISCNPIGATGLVHAPSGDAGDGQGGGATVPTSFRGEHGLRRVLVDRHDPSRKKNRTTRSAEWQKESICHRSGEAAQPFDYAVGMHGSKFFTELRVIQSSWCSLPECGKVYIPPAGSAGRVSRR